MRRSLAIAPFFVLFLVSSVSAAERLVMTLRRTAERIELRDNGGSLLRAFDTTSSVVVNGSAGDDTLVVDFSGGNPIPNGLEFNGGAEATAEGDVIEIRGGSFKRVVVDYTNRHDGSISLDGTVIKYTGLEPVVISGAIADIVFNLPGTGSSVSLQDDGTLGNNFLRLHSVDASFEDTTFNNPPNSLILNSTGGTNTIATSADFSGDFTAGLTINGSAGTTTVSLNNLSLTTGSAALSVTAAAINLNAATISTTHGQDYAGPVTLGTSATLTSTSSGDISFEQTLNGSFGLTVNTAGITTFGGAVGGTTPPASAVTDAPGSTAINGGAFATTGVQTFNDPVTLGANTTFTSSGNITFPGTITGGFSVTKGGSGVMTLATPNTYTGGTTVSAGALLVTNVAGSGTGTGSVAAANGATLAGTGIIAGSAIAQAGGIFAPGNGGIGTLAIQGSASWNGSAGAPTAIFDLDNAGVTSDRLSILGVFVKGPGPVFKFDFAGTGSLNTYTLATFAAGSTFVASDFTFTNLAPGLDGTFTRTANQLHFTVISSAATHFLVSAPASATAGVPFNITVTALDALDSVATTYAGTVHFTSSDGSATLPADATLSGGTGTFSVMLQTVGSQTITATDTVTSSITGTSNAIAVSAGTATHFSVSAVASASAGAAFSFSVTALDQFNNVAIAYAGTVHFTSSDGTAILPADSTLTSGAGTFTTTLNIPGNQTITATDTVNSSMTGTSNAIAVSLVNADVGITKTASAGPYLSGNPITYTMVVSNGGPGTATGVTVTDTIPAATTFGSANSTQGSCTGTTTVTCSIGSIANGSSATITLVLTLPSAAGPVSNTANVTSTTADTNPANDSATSTVNVGLVGSIPTLSQILLMMLVAMLMTIAVVRLRG